MTQLLQYPLLPLGLVLIVAAYLLLSRGLRKAEATNSETLDALIEDMRQVHIRLQAHDLKLTEHGNKMTSMALRGVK